MLDPNVEFDVRRGSPILNAVVAITIRRTLPRCWVKVDIIFFFIFMVVALVNIVTTRYFSMLGYPGGSVLSVPRCFKRELYISETSW